MKPTISSRQQPCRVSDTCWFAKKSRSVYHKLPTSDEKSTLEEISISLLAYANHPLVCVEVFNSTFLIHI